MDPELIDDDREAAKAFYGSRPLLYDGTEQSASIVAWLYDMETIFRICHIVNPLRVLLASRCLIADARMWWMTDGERQMPDRTWAQFRMIVLTRFGPVPAEGPDIDAQYQDPAIYRDMYHHRFQILAAEWHAYPHESMLHYCQRFREAMLPHIPQDIPLPQLQTIVLLRNGVPSPIRQYVIEPTLGRTIEDMTESIMEAEIIAHMGPADAYVAPHEVPADDVGQASPVYEPDPVIPEGAEDPMDDDEDDEVVPVIDIPEDPPLVILLSDDEGEEVEAEPAAGLDAEVIEIDDDEMIVISDDEEYEDDPEEVLFHDGDWDPDSDADSGVSIYTLEAVR